METLVLQHIACEPPGVYEDAHNAVLLASSPAYPNQAFRWGRHAYGVQFHLEVSREMAQDWAGVSSYADALERVLGPDSAAAFVQQLGERAEEMRAHGRRMFEGWLDLFASAEPIVRRPDYVQEARRLRWISAPFSRRGSQRFTRANEVRRADLPVELECSLTTRRVGLD
jgi:hypothetical protein